MACNTITSILKGCDNNIGGIYELWIQDQDLVQSLDSATITTSAHTITALTASTDFVKFEFKRNVGELKTDSAIDLLNGSNIHNVTVTIKLTRREGSKSRAITILGEGQRFLSLIIKSADGTYSYVDYAQLSVSNETTGVAKEDGSMYDLTFVANNDHKPYFIESAVVATLTT